MSLRKTIFDMLEDGTAAGRSGTISQSALIALILASSACLVLSTEPDASISLIAICRTVEIVTLAVFGGEYAARIWTAPEDLRFRQRPAIEARRSYLSSLAGIVDLVALSPIALMGLGSNGRQLAIAFGLLRCLKLVRYSSSLQVLLGTLLREKSALMAGATIILAFAVLAGGFVYALEASGQPDDFGSLRSSIWWAIETIVGSSTDDASPDTAIGKAIAALLTVTGFMMLALPVGIIGASFENSFRQKEFTVSTGMVGRVRIFSSLRADEIVAMTASLRSRRFLAGETIIKQGQIGDEMYFIVSGTVKVVNADGEFALEAGDYFGERALVLTEPRNSTIIASSTLKTLCLDKQALTDLISRRPEIANELMQTIEARRSGSQPQPNATILP